MPKFAVTVYETVSRVFTFEAADEDEARRMGEDASNTYEPSSDFTVAWDVEFVREDSEEISENPDHPT